MDVVAADNLSVEQQGRLKRFNAPACADVHCHCLPGVDDGPATLADSLDLCRALVRDGITHVVATPHQLGRYDGRNSPADVRRAVADLTAALTRERIPLVVVPGADVRVDERLGDLFDADGVLSVADARRYVLLELPHDTLVDIGDLLKALRSRGLTGILTHPERHAQLAGRPHVVAPWLEHGLLVQLTAGSFVGDFGPAAKTAAWEWLGIGLVHVVASDAHDAARRPPRMSDAIDQISDRLSHVIARRLCVDNPLRVLRGEDVPAARVRPTAPRAAAAAAAQRRRA